MTTAMNPKPLTLARSELILGGQKSGKSRRAEALARQWLDQSDMHRAVLIATGQPWDDEMRERIQRHQQDRAQRVPGMATVEEPLALAEALARHSRADTLVVVDCLTLWLTNWLMPMDGRPDRAAWEAERSALLAALPELSSPVLFVSNEVGWGISPLGREVRDFVDELGRLNQAVASRCQDLTLMVAGQAWTRPVHVETDLP